MKHVSWWDNELWLPISLPLITTSTWNFFYWGLIIRRHFTYNSFQKSWNQIQVKKTSNFWEFFNHCEFSIPILKFWCIQIQVFKNLKILSLKFEFWYYDNYFDIFIKIKTLQTVKCTLACNELNNFLPHSELSSLYASKWTLP